MYEFAERFMTDMDVFTATIFVGAFVTVTAAVVIGSIISDRRANKNDE